MQITELFWCQYSRVDIPELTDPCRVTLNNTSDYRTNEQYLTPNPINQSIKNNLYSASNK